LTASVAPVAGETDLADNQLVQVVNVNAAPPLLAAILPLSRFVEVGDIDSGVASGFAVILNTGGVTATGCSIAPVGAPAASGAFTYQTTTPGNVPTGSVNTAVDMLAGAAQNFIFTFTPGTVALVSTEIQLTFDCTNTDPAPSISNLNRFRLGVSTSDTTDIVALSATTSGDGIVHIPGPAGTHAFGVATTNVGDASATITAMVDTGSVILPLTITICETTGVPGGLCLTGPTPPITTSVDSIIDPGEANTFAVFVTATGAVPNLPGTNRMRVLFKEGGTGGAIHGATTVAVTTQ